MATSKNKVTRRQVLTRLGSGAGGLALGTQLGAPHAAAQAPPQRRLEDIVPISGKAGPGLEPFDPSTLKIMDRHGIPGAALAIAKDGKLVLAKGYGWANVTTGEPVQPTTLFGLASLSKPITAVATLLLVDQGKLDLEARVFEFLRQIKPLRGARTDPRIQQVTVRQCLQHSGGWDRSVSGDPINWEPQISRALRARPPISPEQFISFIRGWPLDFAPGSAAKYSNVGYVILGEVVATVSGQPYEKFVAERVLKPMGIKDAGVHELDGKYFAGEAHRHLAGTLTALPPMQLPMVESAGGWSGSVVDMARFLTNLDGSRGKSVLSDKARAMMLAPPQSPIKPRDNGTYFGLGWDAVTVTEQGPTYFKDGSYQGMRTFMKRLPNGVNWALLYNASMEFDPQDHQIAASTIHEVRQVVERFEKLPDIDLFKEYS